ncbi:MAG: carboxypeptidase regulatory-like domain-containing protein [Planctomycetes bacterium]|nr:carboxypeptidase regulatory-like domain-containing protein [Planctomycetota bacterium]
MANSSSRLLLAVGAALVLALALAAWIFLQGERAHTGPAEPIAAPTPDSSEPPKPATQNVVATTEEAGARSNVAGSPAAEAPLPEAYERALSGLVGRIVEPDGTPAPKQQVELLGGILEFLTADIDQLLFHPEDVDIRIEQQKVETDAQGKFHFKKVDPRLYYAIGVNLGRGRSQIRLVDRTPNPGELADLGDIILDAPLTLVGRVLSASGSPIPGARVTASGLPGIIYQAGVGLVEPGIGFVIRESSLGAKLFQPPRFAEKLWDKLPFPSTTTGADGAFRLEGAPSGSLTLLVQSEGHPPLSQNVPASKGPEKNVGDLSLDRGEECDGLVVDELGKPVPNAEVRVCIPSAPSGNRFFFARKPQKADAKGTFRAKGLPGDCVLLAARAPGSATWTLGEPEDLVGDEIKITIPAMRSLVARVTDLDGKPLSAKISVQRNIEGLELFPQIETPLKASVTALEPGAYRVGGLAKGKYRVGARAEGYAIDFQEVEIEGAAEPEVALRLTLEHRIRVTVLGKEAGKVAPLEGAQVFSAPSGNGFERRGFAALGSTRSDREGIALVRCVNEGKAGVVASHPGYATGFAEVTLPETREMSLSLLVGGTIEGRVHDGGKRLDTPKMVLAVMDDPKGDVQSVVGPRSTITDLEGAFRFTHLAPGSYNVLVLPRFLGTNLGKVKEDFFDIFELFNFGGGGGPAKSEAVVEDEQTSKIEIDLQRAGREATANDGRIRGRVTKNGEPLARAMIMASGEEWTRARTAADGTFDLGPMKAGEYQISVMRSGGSDFQQIGSRKVQLRAGAEEILEISVRMGSKVSGRVSSKVKNKPLAGAQVMLSPIHQGADSSTAGGFASTITDARGHFELEELAVGRYRVRATASDHGPASAEIDVTEGGVPPTVDLWLSEAVVVTGKVIFPDAKKRSWAGMQVQPIDGTEMEGDWVQIDIETNSFEIRTLAPGRYRAQLFSSFAGERDSDATDEVTDLDPSRMLPVDFEVPVGGAEDIEIRFAQKPKETPKPAEPGEGAAPIK